MPTARVICPTCATPLELDRQHLGQEVQCGSCNQIFEAKAERRPRDDEDNDRPRRKSRFARQNDDDDYDDDDYDRRPRRRRSSSSNTNGLGVASMVLGICGIVGWCCWPIGLGMCVIGGILGLIGLSSPNRGPAIAGVILNGLFLVVNLGLVVLGFGMNMMNQNNNNPWGGGAQPQQFQQQPQPWNQPRPRNFR